MGERRGRLLRAVIELAEIEMHDLVRGGQLQRLGEVRARVRVATGVVFVDAEVLEGRGERGIQGQGLAEARVGGVAPPRARERDAVEVEGLEVAGRRRELLIELRDGGRELVPAHVKERAVVGSRPALGADGGSGQQRRRREAPGDAAESPHVGRFYRRRPSVRFASGTPARNAPRK
jgi:hypothetical protein